MADHRVSLRDTNDLIKTGASPNTIGVGAVRNAYPIRTANPTPEQVCSDGTNCLSLLDGYWGTKTIVDGSATALFTVPVAASIAIGGWGFYLVEANDGTDFQALSGTFTYSAVNKAGTTTGAIQDATTATVGAKSVSSGTLTLTWTMADATAVASFKLQPAGSLIETTYRVTYFIIPVRGIPTIL